MVAGLDRDLVAAPLDDDDDEADDDAEEEDDGHKQ